MFTHYRTQGFILKKKDRGEADQLLTVYTKDFGKVEILGRAIRKISSKLRSGAELFYLSEIEFIQGRGYKTLTDAILLDSFKNIKRNSGSLAASYKISETFDSLVREREADEKIWRLLKETFETLDNFQIVSPPGNPEVLLQTKLKIIHYYFLWNLLSLLGYRPELYNCLLCQRRLTPEKLYFNAEEGGVICKNCFKKVKSSKEQREINIETIKILRVILEKNRKILSRLKIENSHLKPLDLISDYYFSEVLKKSE